MPRLVPHVRSMRWGTCVLPRSVSGSTRRHTQVLRLTSEEEERVLAVDLALSSSGADTGSEGEEPAGTAGGGGPFRLPMASVELQPGDVVDVPVVYQPREPGSSSASLLLSVGGRAAGPAIRLEAQAEPLRLEFADPSQQRVRFAGVRVGGTSSKRVQVINHGTSSVSFRLVDGLMGGTARLQGQGVSWEPELLTLRRGQAADVRIDYRPEHRAAAFSAPLYARILGHDEDGDGDGGMGGGGGRGLPWMQDSGSPGVARSVSRNVGAEGG